MGYFKNELIAMQVEEADRKPMVYIANRVFWFAIGAVWLMAALTGFMIGVVI